MAARARTEDDLTVIGYIKQQNRAGHIPHIPLYLGRLCVPYFNGHLSKNINVATPLIVSYGAHQNEIMQTQSLLWPTFSESTAETEIDVSPTDHDTIRWKFQIDAATNRRDNGISFGIKQTNIFAAPRSYNLETCALGLCFKDMPNLNSVQVITGRYAQASIITIELNLDTNRLAFDVDGSIAIDNIPIAAANSEKYKAVIGMRYVGTRVSCSSVTRH